MRLKKSRKNFHITPLYSISTILSINAPAPLRQVQGTPGRLQGSKVQAFTEMKLSTQILQAGIDAANYIFKKKILYICFAPSGGAGAFSPDAA